ncbi:hypothetical protein B5F39_08060 [Cloacibacillus sp. An23]|nr:hypothetical protein B5F39_08060 [Cloacibacillus sp. An23]
MRRGRHLKNSVAGRFSAPRRFLGNLRLNSESLLRAAGVPAIDVCGIRMDTKDGADMSGGYHCWAQFCVPGCGWATADPADVRKAMLTENIELKDAGKWIDFFWLGADGSRVILERGARGVAFAPAQAAGELNYFMYPYAEVDGKALNYLSAKEFSYKVTYNTK